MTDFTEGFATGFEVVALIKEKQKAKKAMQEVQNTLQEWQLSGKEPSYVDKLMLGLTVTKVGENYSKIYNDITNSKDSYDKEKMSQSAINLREYNDQVLNFVKMIQTSAKEGTLDLIPWDSVQALMPDVDLTKVLSSIPELKNKQYEAKTKEQNIDIYGKTPESIRQAVGEQAGLIPTGLEPTTAPKAPGISDYKGAVDYLKNFSKITTPPDTFNKVKAGLQNKFPDIDLSDITQESLREPEKAVADTKPKIQDPNDVLFGTNGIMKNYINSGSQLGDEQKTEIRNNYNLIKPSLSADVRTQVEDYLKQIGIDVNASVEEQKNYTIMTDDELSALPDDPLAVEELKRRKAQFGGGLTKWWNKITKPGGTPAYKGTPQQKDYTAMSNDELADLALFGDTSAIEELKRRGLI